MKMYHDLGRQLWAFYIFFLVFYDHESTCVINEVERDTYNAWPENTILGSQDFMLKYLYVLE